MTGPSQVRRRTTSIKNELVLKSREAALTAVQVFNNPLVRFKSETFIVLMTIAWIAMLLAHTQIWQVIVAALLSAVGSAMAVASIANLVVEVAPSEDTSAATAVVGVVRGVFAAIGAQILGLLLAGQGHGGRPDEAAYMHAMGYVAVTSIGVLAIGLLIPASRAGRPGVAGEARRVGAKPA